MTLEPERNGNNGRPSAWGALWGVLTEPGRTFAAFAGQVPILPPYLVAMALALVTALLTMPVTQRIAQQQMATQGGLPAEGLSIFKWFLVGISVVGALARPWVSGVIVALVALFFGQFSSTRAGFTAYLGLVGYASLPAAAGGVVQALLVMSAGSVDALTRISLSPAVFLPDGSSLALRAVLGLLNPFSLWYYAVLCIGFATLNRGKWTRGLSFALTLFAFSALFALLGGLLGGRFVTQMPQMQ
jgi:hypothetical protein